MHSLSDNIQFTALSVSQTQTNVSATPPMDQPCAEWRGVSTSWDREWSKRMDTHLHESQAENTKQKWGQGTNEPPNRKAKQWRSVPNGTDSETDTHPCESSIKSTKRKQIADEMPSSNVRKSPNEMTGMTSSERANMTSTERVCTTSGDYLNGIYEPKGFDNGTGHVYLPEPGWARVEWQAT